jgi:hypothetical protein
MEESTFTRRALLRQGLQLPAAGAALMALSACGEGEKKPKAIVCADPNALSVAENSLRKAGHYEEKAPDPTKTCNGCGFFTMEKAPCGKCEIFQGPVNSGGHCDSWAARPS